MKEREQDFKNIAIIGANGSIGNEFLQEFSRCKNIENIFAFSRTTINYESPKIKHANMDITNEESIKEAVAIIKQDQLLDLVIIATGILHNENISPEKSLKDVDINKFIEVFKINTFGPALIAKHFIPLISKVNKSVFCALSARVGSISENKLGGWYAYRTSKAALNMLIKTISIETKLNYKKLTVIGLHPGTVNSNLSRPFQQNIAKSKLFTPTQSAKKLIHVINNVTIADTGKCISFDGTTIGS